MSTYTYWRIIGNEQKFYDLESLQDEAQLRMVASDATTIDCDITRTVGRIIVNTPFTIEVK